MWMSTLVKFGRHLISSNKCVTFLYNRLYFCQITTMATSETKVEKQAKITNEGKAEIFSPSSVFYNPVQEFNRDLTISVITQCAKEHFIKLREKNKNTDKSVSDNNDAVNETQNTKCEDQILECGKRYEEGLKILEGLSASGLRSVRFALEIPGVKEIIANDFDQNAVEFIKKNVEHNKVKHLVTPSLNDANMVTYQNRKYSNRFDVIDLDPYGSPATFLDGAVQAVKDGGLLCVTCTDMAVLCGNAPETCHSKYGAVSLKVRHCHEMALRIVLQCIESHANRYSRYIVPLLSISVDFYIRMFVRIYTGQQKVKESVTKLARIYSCIGCGDYKLERLANKVATKNGQYKFTPPHSPSTPMHCPECGFRYHVGGPIWAEPLHDLTFVENVLNSVLEDTAKFGTADRLVGILSVICEELPDQSLYFITDDLCKTLHCTPPNFLQFRSAILNAGYDVSLSHAANNSIKTNAPTSVIWDILRCWVKEHPVKEERLQEGTAAKVLLSKEPNLQANFTIREDSNPNSRKKGLLRWQMNPERDWGPKARAKQGNIESLDERRNKGRERSKRKAEGEDVGTKRTKLPTNLESSCNQWKHHR